jgi:alpha-L-rhamnosidase
MFVDDAVRPLAIVTPQPRFGWRVPLEGRGRAQSAYRILVATDPGKIEDDQPDLWDSGRVESSQSMHVPYDGERLASNMDCYWSVQLWDEAGNAIDSDRIEPFGTPLFDQADWQAQWIGMGDPNEPFPDTATFQRGGMDPAVEAFEPDQHAPMLAREFELTQPVKRARAFVCGWGCTNCDSTAGRSATMYWPTPRTDFASARSTPRTTSPTSLNAGRERRSA